MMKEYYVYILASKKHGTLYIGVTNNLTKRTYEHKHMNFNKFSHKYKVNKLVYYEIFSDVNDAIYREKQLKHWNRDWKIDLIEQDNPEWIDFYYGLV